MTQLSAVFFTSPSPRPANCPEEISLRSPNTPLAHDPLDSREYNRTMSKHTEEFKVDGDDLLKKVKHLIAEGNIRRITIRNKDGKNIVELPLTVGVVGAVLAPPLAAVGAIAALVTECTIIVERESS